MNNQNNQIPIPDEVQKWIDDVCPDPYYSSDWELGAKEMYQHLSPEIEALKKERDEYRELLHSTISALNDEEWTFYGRITETLSKYTKP